MKLATAVCCFSALLYIAHAQYSQFWAQPDAFGGTDIGVYKLDLFRNNGPEDANAARRKRNVLVWKLLLSILWTSQQTTSPVLMSDAPRRGISSGSLHLLVSTCSARELQEHASNYL